MEPVTMVSAGLDVGSATTQFRVSAVDCEWKDTRYVSVGARVLHEAETILTPFLGDVQIDSVSLSRYVEDELDRAEMRAEQFDTAFVVLTGLALERENARSVGEMLSAKFGRLSSIAAGDALECELAARGSGAVELSRTSGEAVLQLDVGGGTTKIIECRAGRIIARAAMDVGGRLARFDDDGVLVSVEEPLRRFAARYGIALVSGEVPGQGAIAFVCLQLAQAVRTIAEGGGSEDSDFLLREMAGVISTDNAVFSFSGGVSEFVYGTAGREYGDLGKPLGAALRQVFESAGRRVVELPNRARATVIAAAEWTTELSGSTVYFSDLALLPVYDLPVLRPSFSWEPQILADEVVSALDIAYGAHPADLRPHAVHYSWVGHASVARLHAFAAGVTEWHQRHWPGSPVVLLGRADIAGVLGAYLAEELGEATPVISVDGIEVMNGDHVDIGRPLGETGALPVTMKTLMFDTPLPHRGEESARVDNPKQR